MRDQSRLQRRRSRERDRQASRISETLAEKIELTGPPSGTEQTSEHTNEGAAPLEKRPGHDFGELEVTPERRRDRAAKLDALDKARHAEPMRRAEGTHGLDGKNDLATFSAPEGRAPMLRDGMTLPGGAVMENVNVSASAVVGLLQRLAVAGGGGFGSDADFSSRAGPQIDAAIGAMLNPRTVSGSFTETRGVNCTWTWRVSFKMGEPVEIAGGGSGEVNRNFGGSGQISNSTTNSTTDSAKVTGGFKEGEAKSGGEASVGGEAGTSSTRSETSGSTTTTQGGGAAKTQNVLRRFRAPVIVEAQTQGDLDMSGTDYVNPFKWGMYAAEAADSIERKTGEANVGSLEYYRSEGIAAPAAPAAPAAKKGWVEHELGITERTESNFGKTANALTINPAELSRAGARPLAPDVAAPSREASTAPRVNLIHGGQADAYCDAMSAAAFTTPIPGGGSDIFLHSGIDLASMRGQHTLHHELAHADQFQSGEGRALNGLGGDASQRNDLERRADEAADRTLARNRGLTPTPGADTTADEARKRRGA